MNYTELEDAHLEELTNELNERRIQEFDLKQEINHQYGDRFRELNIGIDLFSQENRIKEEPLGPHTKPMIGLLEELDQFKSDEITEKVVDFSKFISSNSKDHLEPLQIALPPLLTNLLGKK